MTRASLTVNKWLLRNGRIRASELPDATIWANRRQNNEVRRVLALRAAILSTITFMQTCDAARYAPLLEIGSRTVKTYVSKFGYGYLSFIGLRRGRFAWQASYNRIPMLMEMVEAGYTGWVCYMDADSYVVDIGFDLDNYLADKSDVALIAAHSCVQPPVWFDINNGVFLINLGHSKGKEVIKQWHARYLAISDNDFNKAEVWGDIPNDQQLLHEAMQEVSDLESHTIVDMSHSKLLNYHNGRFIRQILREQNGTVEERAAKMRVDVDSILNTITSVSPIDATTIHSDVLALEESFIRSVYRVFLLRDPAVEELYHALRRYRAKRNTIEQEMKDCLACDEFAKKSSEFLKQFAPSSNILK